MDLFETYCELFSSRLVKRRLLAIAFFSLLCLASRSYADPFCQQTPDDHNRRKTINDVLKQIGPAAEARMKPFFDRAGITYPPQSIVFVVLKEEMEFEVWAGEEGKWAHLRTYDFLGSGSPGPKQKKGDKQVPEGIYQIVELNPSSRFHLSMKLNYPNSYDMEKARADNRTNLGGDIYIHGDSKSRGCLAVGDRAIEELFVLAAKSGAANIKVIISPMDMRKKGPALNMPSQPAWVSELYQAIGNELTKFKDEDASRRADSSM